VRVLVTGGSGFIGSHVVDQLIEQGIEPRILDLAPSRYHGGRVETVIGSVTDPDAVERAVAGCHAVVHLAAVADVGHVRTAPASSENVNSRGTANVLEAARRARVERVVYGSTTWVYSDCVELEVDEDTPIPPPAHLYTATKLAGELYCRAYADAYGLDATILRFGIPYGPRAREEAVVPRFVARALASEPLTVAGSGEQFRNFVYVEELAAAVVDVVTTAATGRVYNLASSEITSVREIAETVRAIVGDVEIVNAPARAGDFGGKRVCSERAERELGWKARVTFAEGVRRYVEWRRGAGKVELEAIGPKPGPRVLILSADIGEGHDLPARAIAAEVRAERPDADVEIVDGLAAMGSVFSAAVSGGSRVIFRWLPWLFELQYLSLTLAPTRWLAQRLLYLVAGRRLRRLVEAYRPDAVVSTYPGVTPPLGELRRRGRLKVPMYSAITDLAGLHWWAHRGVDFHFVTHPESVPEVERIAGEGSVRAARPPIADGFLEERSQSEARAALGLPDEGKIVLVSGGGWGVGDVTGAVEAALRVDAQVVCLCGRNEALRRSVTERFDPHPRVAILGFTDRMNDLLAAADALVHSTAGLTVLEAIIRGCPAVSYGFPVGHVRVNNRAYRRSGLARTARTRTGLTDQLRRALASRPLPDSSFARRRSVASFVLEGRMRVEPLSVGRQRAGLVGATLAATAFALASNLATDYTYPLLAKPLDLRPLTNVSTTRPEAGILVDVPSAEVPSAAADLYRSHIHATFAIGGSTSPSPLPVLERLGDDALPTLKGGAPVRWLETKDQLKHAASALGLPSHGMYAMPRDGFTLGQYALAHMAGGSPVTGAVKLSAGHQPRQLASGQVVRLSLGSDQRQWDAVISSLAGDLKSAGLHGVAVSELLRERAHQRRDSG
jgi:nucleoside-diphosphate-sugar epimerase/UDP-N-acetylglucosamine:LPS N-acetylglucosamine transferase